MKPTLIGYLGILMMGLALLSIGLLISAMTDSQIVAAVLTFGVSLLLWVLNWMADSATITLAAVMNKVSAGLWEKLHLGLGGPTLGDLLGQISIIGLQDSVKFTPSP